MAFSCPLGVLSAKEVHRTERNSRIFSLVRRICQKRKMMVRLPATPATDGCEDCFDNGTPAVGFLASIERDGGVDAPKPD